MGVGPENANGSRDATNASGGKHVERNGYVKDARDNVICDQIQMIHIFVIIDGFRNLINKQKLTFSSIDSIRANDTILEVNIVQDLLVSIHIFQNYNWSKAIPTFHFSVGCLVSAKYAILLLQSQLVPDLSVYVLDHDLGEQPHVGVPHPAPEVGLGKLVGNLSHHQLKQQTTHKSQMMGWVKVKFDEVRSSNCKLFTSIFWGRQLIEKE